MSRSIKPWRAIWSSMWSRKGTPVLMLWRPVPSRLMATRTRVSWVLRVISAVRMSSFGVGGFETILGAGGVRLQAFATSEGGGNALECLGASLRHFDQAGAFLEVVHAQRRRKPRRPSSGKHVVWARTVITE